jgi:hypothetical protein
VELATVILFLFFEMASASGRNPPLSIDTRQGARSVVAVTMEPPAAADPPLLQSDPVMLITICRFYNSNRDAN